MRPPSSAWPFAWPTGQHESQPPQPLTLEDRRRLAEWGLGTYHATTFVVVLAAFLYRAGGLGSSLHSLNTLLGLTLFGALWVTTWWTTGRMLRSTSWQRPSGHVAPLPWFGLGLVWGGVNGVLFVASAFVLLFLVQLPSAGPAVLKLFFLAFPLLMAFGVGAVVGLVLAAIDLVLWETAIAWVHQDE